MKELQEIAEEVLATFEAVTNAARRSLEGRGVTVSAFATINGMMDNEVVAEMQQLNSQRQGDCLRLLEEPAVARLVVADETGNQETLYISSGGTVATQGVAFCSYMSPKGQLAALTIGDSRVVRLPTGSREFALLEKVSLKPVESEAGWDAQPAVQYRGGTLPLTIRSLRELLGQATGPEAAADVLEAWLASSDIEPSGATVAEGIQRNALKAIQLRVAPILDAFQDRIFRLPIHSRIAILGPPGTGKTTTLVRRLRQKVDSAYLDADTELELVQGTDAAGLPHPSSWLLFSPTELLRLYVKDALGREGVPASDERVRTWHDYRREVGRKDLRFLSTGRGSDGLVMTNNEVGLLPETPANQAAWFDAFDDYQRAMLVGDLQVEAQRLASAANPRAVELGRQILGTIARTKEHPIQLIAELASQGERLRAMAAAGREEQRALLLAPLKGYAKSNPAFLDDLMTFAGSLNTVGDDESEEEEAEGDEEELAPRTSSHDRAAVRNMFVGAVRSNAIAQATGRTLPATSQAGRLLAWLQERGLDLPDLRDVGAALLVQRSAGRLAAGPSACIAGVSLRYRRFRRAMREEGRWYAAGRFPVRNASFLEVDLILLAMLRIARQMTASRILVRRLGHRAPPLLDAVARLQRNQVLVDEATDFSPVQLACMGALASTATDSFFVSGDINQRLTRWGSRSEDDLRWADPRLTFERIDLIYRQTRRLADFGAALGQAQGHEAGQRGPEHIDNLGYQPVLGISLASIPAQAAWLAARIREINDVTDGALPTVAVLTTTDGKLEPLAAALTEELQDMNVQAVACHKGQFQGQRGDVRVFEVEHIKGLEFEAVFFMDIDLLKAREPDLFGRYLYVGATRAATFLGITCAGSALPAELEHLSSRMVQGWP